MPYCLKCEYDLTGLDSVCPECGTHFSAKDPLSYDLSPGKTKQVKSRKYRYIMLAIAFFSIPAIFHFLIDQRATLGSTLLVLLVPLPFLAFPAIGFLLMKLSLVLDHMRPPCSKLWISIIKDDLNDFKRLLCEHPEMNRLDQSALLCAQHCRIEMLQELIRFGIDVDIVHNQNAPLDRAADYGHFELCKWLLENGADVNRDNGDAFTPIFSAVYGRSIDIVKLFVEAGANIYATYDDPPVNILTYCIEYGTEEIHEYLTELIGENLGSNV